MSGEGQVSRRRSRAGVNLDFWQTELRQHGELAQASKS